MNLSLAFVRIFFTLLSMLFVTIYSSHAYPHSTMGIVGGLVVGLFFGIFLICLDIFFRRFNLRSFNIAFVGLLFGYLMGEALVLILHSILHISFSIVIHTQLIELIEIAIFLFGIYLGLVLTLRASDELYVSIPFVKFAPMRQKKRDLIIDSSVLADTRIVDLSLSGLVDHQIIVPRFIVRELYSLAESGDENTKNRTKRSLETLKKLEDYSDLGIRFNDTDFPEVKDINAKLFRLARLLDSNVLTADIGRVQTTSVEGIRVINIHSLSNALKPLSETGEVIQIKIQRYGKEPNQGVGYLEDGTMVVVNGGGDYIGETIDANVLSVKHTSSGRMIFCNVVGGETHDDEPFKEDDSHS